MRQIKTLSGSIPLNPCCSNRDNLKVLDIGITTERLFYKCLKCQHIINEGVLD
jgi:hypothetical protein